MPLHQSAPSSGAPRKRTHFKYEGTPRGGRWTAYIAGPCLWIDCHPLGKTKPCLEAVTKGALPCPWCGTSKPAEATGYQPLYREIDNKPVCVIVHEDVREKVDALRFHARVTVGREEGITDGVFLAPCVQQLPRFSSTLADRNTKADVTMSCLTFWKIPELCVWYAAQESGAGAAPRVALTDQGELYSPTMQAAAKRAGATTTDDPAALAEYAATVKRLTHNLGKLPPKNGKH